MKKAPIAVKAVGAFFLSVTLSCSRTLSETQID